jgi:hypothetical protein
MPKVKQVRHRIDPDSFPYDVEGFIKHLRKVIRDRVFYLELVYTRPENAEERKMRLGQERVRKKKEAERELRELARLKEKYPDA